MHSFLQSLHDDHRQIRRLLAAFETELEAFAAGEDADFDILEFGIDYCVDYLDRVHHRKEEQLLQRLRALDPGGAVSMVELSGQHHRLEQLAHQVADAFGAARDGAVLAREGLVDGGRQLLQRYRHHLSWEEAILFPTIEKALSAKDCDELATPWSDEIDPLHPDSPKPAALLAAMASLAESGQAVQRRY